MEAKQIKCLMENLRGEEGIGKPLLIETHVSWVILAGPHAYKIKKPRHFSFLDFSTPELRKYYCEREVLLNRRLAGAMYIGIVPIYDHLERPSLNSEGGKVIDYAVLMKRMDPSKGMDKLLGNK